MLPFPPEKGYLPQRVLSQIDCSERQPLFEGGLAQSSEIKVLSSKRRDNQSWLNVCFLSWDYCNHKAAVWQHLKCAKKLTSATSGAIILEYHLHLAQGSLKVVISVYPYL